MKSSKYGTTYPVQKIPADNLIYLFLIVFRPLLIRDHFLKFLNQLWCPWSLEVWGSRTPFKQNFANHVRMKEVLYFFTYLWAKDDFSRVALSQMRVFMTKNETLSADISISKN